MTYFDPKQSIDTVVSTYKGLIPSQKREMMAEVIDYILQKTQSKKLSMNVLREKNLYLLLKAVTFPFNSIDNTLMDIISEVYEEIKSGNSFDKWPSKLFVFPDDGAYGDREKQYIEKYFPVTVPFTIFGKRFYALYTYDSYKIYKKDPTFFNAYLVIPYQNQYLKVFVWPSNALSVVKKALKWLYLERIGKEEKLKVNEVAEELKNVRQLVAGSEENLLNIHPYSVIPAMEVNTFAVKTMVKNYLINGLQYTNPRDVNPYFWYDDTQHRVEYNIQGSFIDTLKAYQILKNIENPLTIEEKRSILNLQYSDGYLIRSPRFQYFYPSDEFLFEFVVNYAHKKGLPYLLPQALDPVADKMFIEYLKFLESEPNTKTAIKKAVDIELEIGGDRFVNFVEGLSPSI